MRRRLAVCCAPQLVVALDFALLGVSAPALRADLGLPETTLAWAFSAYSLSFGALLLIAGRAADTWGGRRLLAAGLGVFGIGAVAAATAGGAPVLLGARAAQGAGAALMTPAALALLAGAFAEGPERRRALAIYGVVISLGFVAGALIGGAVAGSLGWRWSVGLNAAPALLALALLAITPFAPVVVALGAMPSASRGNPTGGPPATLGGAPQPGAASPWDLPGALLLAAAVASFALGAGGDLVADVRWALIAAAFLAAGAFAARERRAAVPLVPPALALRPTVRAAGAGAIVVTATGVGAVLLLTLHLQEDRDYSPLATGLTFAAFGSTALAGGAVASRVAARRGGPATLATGLALQGAALLFLGTAPLDRALAVVLAGLAAFGFGHTIANAALPLTALAGVPRALHGTAGGAVATLQFLGAAAGPLAALALADAGGLGGGLRAGGLACLAGAAAVAVLARRGGAGGDRGW